MAHDVVLGKMLSGDEQRDAIHIAVAPVLAYEKLSPGQDIGFVDEGCELVGPCESPIGIVDPFLKSLVFPGQRFWMFLYPQTITSLRHDWTHPAFTKDAVEPVDDVATSKRWIEDFADKIDQTYSRLMEAAENWAECNDYTYDNSERYKDHWDKFPEFWKHYEIVTGKKVDCEKDSFFTCSC